MDTSRWKSMAVKIDSWRDIWALKKLNQYQYLRPGAIISTIVDDKIKELADKEGISVENWREKYHKSNGVRTEQVTKTKKRKKHL